MGLFGRKSEQPPPPPPPPPPTLKEQIRENKRGIDRSCRELDRERAKLEQQEKTLQMQIRKVARDGQMSSARVMAKDLVRTRANISKMYQMRTQMQSVSMQMTSMQTTQAMSDAMGSVVKTMTAMNSQFSLPSMQQVIMQYEKESGKMEMTQEMMDDALEDAMGIDEADEDEVINQVMDELGLEAGAKLGAVGATASGAPDVVQANEDAAGEFEKRMAELTKKK
mmetsp:Transcript_21966/g.53661  ORF Transcript_21966/g.53661 Transcript_21966/m.53661 type:complete len:224 (+) Transcript_21966:83-754(+)|eukprot:CAMPEP_0198338994 /NCGR_PEP_ID=MMETSP1450-20131203/37665_1 /TAXON_ID=753684 ORGANISM="Madagascaria erythrocladiodes, Strain CCMP3234" /NCGR_SAMPLE_ID=MMETSP1450 /ASSEMBLY_ACC=CAM_ASM_001115 /LENGTH=223 /DNA_ID=CAMNT_0044043893 /DNA_START=63 /DNA_END=734 /DNA_ORIENTATION=-